MKTNQYFLFLSDLGGFYFFFFFLLISLAKIYYTVDLVVQSAGAAGLESLAVDTTGCSLGARLAGFYGQVRFLLSLLPPNEGVTLSMLCCMGLEEGDTGNMKLPFLPSSMCPFLSPCSTQVLESLTWIPYLFCRCFYLWMAVQMTVSVRE
jgi:hypothetical protein